MGSNKYPLKRDRTWLLSSDDWNDPESLPSTRPARITPLKKFKVKVNAEEVQDSFINDTRINYCITAGEKLKECPYQKSHLILEQRWIRHLCKCRGNYLKECAARKIPVTIGICKWNNAHHLHISHLGAHELNCPSRVKVPESDGSKCYDGPHSETGHKCSESEEVEEGQADSSTTDEEDEENHSTDSRKRPKLNLNDDGGMAQQKNSPLESWEDGASSLALGQPAHNPSQAILKGNIPFIRIPSGLTKRDRGTFRALQIARVRERPDSESE